MLRVFKAGGSKPYRDRALLRALVMAAAAIAPALPAHAWIVQQIDPNGTTLASATVIKFDTDPGIDLLEIHKYFRAAPDQHISLRLMFIREANDQDTIKIVDEIIYNLAPAGSSPWHDFHVALVDFNPDTPVWFINPGDARASQQTGGASRLGGVPVSASATQIDWEDAGEMVPPGKFRDAPANQLVIRGLVIDVSNLDANDSFVLKEWPTIPEPAAAALLGGGMMVAALRRRLGHR